MENNSEKKNNNISLKVLYYSKSFLSFSKVKKEALDFLINGGYDLIIILFKLKKPKKDNFFLTNIDIESFSSIKEEREVLLLPLSCFEIINISSKKKNNSMEYIEVKLQYLENYEEDIKKQIEDKKRLKNNK